MPVSLAVGTVRTPKFAVIHKAYFIMLEVEKRLSIFDIRCIMGLEAGTADLKDCKSSYSKRTGLCWMMRMSFPRDHA